MACHHYYLTATTLLSQQPSESGIRNSHGLLYRFSQARETRRVCGLPFHPCTHTHPPPRLSQYRNGVPLIGSLRRSVHLIASNYQRMHFNMDTVVSISKGRNGGTYFTTHYFTPISRSERWLPLSISPNIRQGLHYKQEPRRIHAHNSGQLTLPCQ